MYQYSGSTDGRRERESEREREERGEKSYAIDDGEQRGKASQSE